MAAIDISSTSAPLNTGVLQLQNGVAMDSTLRNVADQSNTTSPLKLSTSGVQVASTLQITTNSNPYIDAEDGSGNNRFQVGRDPSSQVVNIDFASNPTGGTNQVGAIRTYTDGVNLADVMSFRKDGNVGFGTTSPAYAVSIERTTGNAILSLQGNSGTFISISRFSNNSTRPRLELYKSRGTISTPAIVQTNDELGSVDFYGYDGSANQRVGILYVNAESVVGSTITPQMAFGLGTSAGATTYKMVIKNDGNITIGNELTTLGARLGIKGSGSTSATTSLLVQNSSGTNLLQVVDNNTTLISNTVSINQTAPSVNAMTVQHAGAWNGTVGLFARSAIAIYAQSNLGADAGNPDGASIVAIGGAQAGYKSVGLRSNRAIISAGNAVDIVDSAMLQVDSTTQGFLPPRMTNAQRAAITTPAIGLMVYCTDAVEGIYVYKSTGWTFVI